MVKVALRDVLRQTLHKAQNGVRPVIENVVEQILLDLLREEVIEEASDVHIVKYFDMKLPNGLSNTMVTSNLFMAPIAPFVRHKTDTAMQDRKQTTTRAPKRPEDNITAFDDESDLLPNSSDSRSVKITRKKSSKRCSERNFATAMKQGRK